MGVCVVYSFMYVYIGLVLDVLAHFSKDFPTGTYLIQDQKSMAKRGKPLTKRAGVQIQL